MACGHADIFGGNNGNLKYVYLDEDDVPSDELAYVWTVNGVGSE